MRRMTIGIAAALLCAGQAQALILPSESVIRSSLAGDVFTGVGTLNYIYDGTRGYHGCTASLVSSRVVITASHCLDNNPAFRFVLGDADGGFASYGLASSHIVRHYADGGETDIALIRLDRAVTGKHEIYGIYDQSDEIGRVATLVGAGYLGTLATGVDASLGDDGLTRYGYNRVDMTAQGYDDYLGRTQPGSRSREDVLLFDYDNGTTTNDMFGRYVGTPDTGVYIDGELREAGTIYGDSGGSMFIDGKIAGIHSYMFSGSEHEGSCGRPGDVDVAAPGRFNCYDGSAGDAGGAVRTSFYAGAINRYVAAVPEPSTWAMMIVGMGLAGAMQRRRRARVAVTVG